MRSILILAALCLTTGCASAPRQQDQGERGDWLADSISASFGDWLSGRISGTDDRTETQKMLDDEQFDRMTKLPADPNAARGSSGADTWGRGEFR